MDVTLEEQMRNANRGYHDVEVTFRICWTIVRFVVMLITPPHPH